jgi:hypothetical protein
LQPEALAAQSNRDDALCSYHREFFAAMSHNATGGSNVEEIGVFRDGDFSPLHVAPKPDEYAAAFVGTVRHWRVRPGKMMLVTRLQSTAEHVGAFWTEVRADGDSNRFDRALSRLPPVALRAASLANTMQVRACMMVPAGVCFLGGLVAPQTDGDGREWLPGGGTQIYIPQLVVDRLWPASQAFLAKPMTADTYKTFATASAGAVAECERLHGEYLRARTVVHDLAARANVERHRREFATQWVRLWLELLAATVDGERKSESKTEAKTEPATAAATTAAAATDTRRAASLTDTGDDSVAAATTQQRIGRELTRLLEDEMLRVYALYRTLVDTKLRAEVREYLLVLDAHGASLGVKPSGATVDEWAEILEFDRAGNLAAGNAVGSRYSRLAQLLQQSGNGEASSFPLMIDSATLGRPQVVHRVGNMVRDVIVRFSHTTRSTSGNTTTVTHFYTVTVRSWRFAPLDA